MLRVTKSDEVLHPRLDERWHDLHRQYVQMLKELFAIGDDDCERDPTGATVMRKAKGAFLDMSKIELAEE